MNPAPTRHYEQFQPPERLTLLIEAMARDDEGEVERLQRSCPRATFTGRDPQFEDRWSMAFDILAVVSIDLRCLGGKLKPWDRRFRRGRDSEYGRMGRGRGVTVSDALSRNYIALTPPERFSLLLEALARGTAPMRTGWTTPARGEPIPRATPSTWTGSTAPT